MKSRATSPQALMRRCCSTAPDGIPPASSTCPPISRRSSCRRAPRSSTRSRTSGSISARTGSQTPSSKTTTPSSTPLATRGESSLQSQTESHPSECATALTSVSRHDLWWYYLQTEKLWPPILWSLAFMAVNAVRIVATVLERRPIILSEKEEQLYRIAFSSIDKREFLRLANLARWVDYSPGEVILEKGRPVSDAIVLISGGMEAILNSNTRMALRPGQLIGDAGAYSGLASPVDVVACGHGTLAKWDLRHLTEFTASRPVLRAKLSNIVSADLAAKLRDVTSAVSGLAGEPVAHIGSL